MQPELEGVEIEPTVPRFFFTFGWAITATKGAGRTQAAGKYSSTASQNMKYTMCTTCAN